MSEVTTRHERGFNFVVPSMILSFGHELVPVGPYGFHVFSSYLVNLQIPYRVQLHEDNSLTTLALEVDVHPFATDTMSPTELPPLAPPCY